MRALGRQTFETRVGALSSYAGTEASVQRFTNCKWTTIRVLSLDAHSQARFHVSARAGSRIRVLVPPSQAEPGYVGGFSRPLRIAS